MPLVVVVVVVLTWVRVPDGSTLSSVMVLPDRGVVPAVSMPDRVKDWFVTGAVLLVAMVRVVGWRADGLTAGVVLLGVMVTAVDLVLAPAAKVEPLKDEIETISIATANITTSPFRITNPPVGIVAQTQRLEQLSLNATMHKLFVA